MQATTVACNEAFRELGGERSEVEIRLPVAGVVGPPVGLVIRTPGDV